MQTNEIFRRSCPIYPTNFLHVQNPNLYLVYMTNIILYATLFINNTGHISKMFMFSETQTIAIYTDYYLIEPDAVTLITFLLTHYIILTNHIYVRFSN